MAGTTHEKLITTLAAAGDAGLTRAGLFRRLDDVFETEGDLAKALGPLVADGRMVRAARKRPGRPDEFVYTVPGADRQEPAPPQPAHKSALAAAEPVKTARPQASKRKRPGELRATVLAALRAASEPLKSSAVASALEAHVSQVVKALRELATQGDVESIGTSRATRWRATGIAYAPEAEKAPEPEPPRAALPAPIAHPDACDEPRCAIEDTGLFAINDGNATIRLTPKAIHKVVGFLELTQHVWKGRP